jgi:hypothetical protein
MRRKSKKRKKRITYFESHRGAAVVRDPENRLGLSP